MRVLLLVGGGHAHVHVLKYLGLPAQRRELEQLGVETVLVARDVQTPYSGMLPGYIAGHYTYDQIHIDLDRLCEYAGVRLVHASCEEIVYRQPGRIESSSSSPTEATGTAPTAGAAFMTHSNDEDPNKPLGTCICDNGERIEFHCLSIDVGSAPSVASQSLLEHPKVIPVKPISQFCSSYASWRDRFQKLQKERRDNDDNEGNSGSSQPQRYRIGVVGGGAGAVEVLLSLQYSLQNILSTDDDDDDDADADHDRTDGVPVELDMVLYTRGESLLKQHNHGVRKRMERVLKERNVTVYYDAEVNGASNTDDDRLKLNVSGGKLRDDELVVDECLLCTTADGAEWLSARTPFATDDRGFLKVEPTYQVVDAPGVFAAGDCCGIIGHPRPKAGVFAVRAGPPISENIMGYLSGKPLKPSVPQQSILGLITTGNKYAIASKGSYFSLAGSWMWLWKDHIDRKWMAQYTTDISPSD